jgi:hypothetical protein
VGDCPQWQQGLCRKAHYRPCPGATPRCPPQLNSSPCPAAAHRDALLGTWWRYTCILCLCTIISILFCDAYTCIYRLCIISICVTHTPVYIYCLFMISILCDAYLYFLSVYYFYSVRRIHLYFCIHCLYYSISVWRTTPRRQYRGAVRKLVGCWLPHTCPHRYDWLIDWLIDWLTIADWSIGFIHMIWLVDRLIGLISDWLVSRGDAGSRRASGWCQHTRLHRYGCDGARPTKPNIYDYPCVLFILCDAYTCIFFAHYFYSVDAYTNIIPSVLLSFIRVTHTTCIFCLCIISILCDIQSLYIPQVCAVFLFCVTQPTNQTSTTNQPTNQPNLPNSEVGVQIQYNLVARCMEYGIPYAMHPKVQP